MESKGVIVNDRLLLNQSGDGNTEASDYGDLSSIGSQTDTEAASQILFYQMKATGSIPKSPSKIEFHLVKESTKSTKYGPRRNIYSKPNMNSEISNTPKTNVTKSFKNADRETPFRDLNFHAKDKIKAAFSSKRSKCDNSRFKEFDSHQQNVKPKVDVENLEIYYFDHGSPDFFRTTDCPPHLVSEILAQQTYHHATKFWAEVFGTLNIGLTFIVAFLLQLYRFILYGFLRALIVGFMQITSDYLIKPILAISFNGFLQPPLIFLQNIFKAISEVGRPIAKLLEYFVQPFVNLLNAFRIVQLTKNERTIVKHKKRKYFV